MKKRITARQGADSAPASASNAPSFATKPSIGGSPAIEAIAMAATRKVARSGRCIPLSRVMSRVPAL
jgi:hypothetical protein